MDISMNVKEFGNFFDDHLASFFCPNFIRNCKFCDFIRFLSKTNSLCPYLLHIRWINRD